jgi:hypothetical protein
MTIIRYEVGIIRPIGEIGDYNIKFYMLSDSIIAFLKKKDSKGYPEE